MAKFQVMLGGEWKDYSHQEDKILKRAYMAGFPNVKFHLRGHGALCQNYNYDFGRMVQVNKDTGKERKIRQPLMPAGPTTKPQKWKAPSKPLVPAGPTTVVNVPPGSAGKTIQVPHPRVKGAFISVHVPASAKPGQAMLVPVPAAAAVTATGTPAPAIKSSIAAQPAAKSSSDGGWTTGAKVATGTTAVVGVFGAAVGGAILGDHIDEHGLDATLEAAGDGIVDAGEATGDFFVDAGEFVVDAAEDVGDFVMDLF